MRKCVSISVVKIVQKYLHQDIYIIIHYDWLFCDKNAQVHLLNCGLTHDDNIQQNWIVLNIM